MSNSECYLYPYTLYVCAFPVYVRVGVGAFRSVCCRYSELVCLTDGRYEDVNRRRMRARRNGRTRNPWAAAVVVRYNNIYIFFVSLLLLILPVNVLNTYIILCTVRSDCFFSSLYGVYDNIISVPARVFSTIPRSTAGVDDETTVTTGGPTG